MNDPTGIQQNQHLWKTMSERKSEQDFRFRYSEKDWIVHHLDTIKEGDIVIYEGGNGVEIEGKFLEFIGDDGSIMVVERLDDGLADMLGIYDEIIFIKEKKQELKICTCGARHTSQPNFHLSYCDLK